MNLTCLTEKPKTSKRPRPGSIGFLTQSGTIIHLKSETDGRANGRRHSQIVYTTEIITLLVEVSK